MNLLEVSALHVAYGSETVLEGLGFELYERETLAVLGRSGCGKTTLLKTLAGLLAPQSGAISLLGQAVIDLPPQQRNMVYLYQEPLLFPHLSVAENIAFGLRLRKEPDSAVRQKTKELLGYLELSDFAGKMPEQLSGGQKQRVAFGRALIIHPTLLLLDEPFGNLDVETRANMQLLFKRVARELGIAAILVTHDLKEALLLGDRLAYLDQGRLDVFADRAAFFRDPRTGLQGEIDFWKNLIA